ncbi:MAG: hypothetical protein J0H53_05385 [Rhizobiales bacterium]|nr:hypothetical protein [Hyphomicrobiales bacterium]OJU37160.1 MAG: hypothetical protein BGN94_08205 [Rhizobiales bacterium 68-8]
MAEVRFDAFADAFQSRLDELGYSLRQAEQKWSQTDRAMLSRAVNGKALSAGNYLLLCEMAGLDPYAFVERGKHRQTSLKAIREHMVTLVASRETGAAR